MESVIWGLIGTIVGASASIITTHLNNRSSINIQRSSESFKRAELFREFQRDNLLKLQERISISLRLVGKAYFEDFLNYKKTNKWQSNLLSIQLNDEIHESFRQLSIKAERIDNNELRDEVKSLKIKMDECLSAEDFESSRSKLVSLSKAFEILTPKLGEVLRANY